jgi:transcriptional regulator of NAD metabolism
MLSSLTGGVHLHTLACNDEETFLRIKMELQEAGILYSG